MLTTTNDTRERIENCAHTAQIQASAKQIPFFFHIFGMHQNPDTSHQIKPFILTRPARLE